MAGDRAVPPAPCPGSLGKGDREPEQPLCQAESHEAKTLFTVKVLCKSHLEGHEALGKVKPWLRFTALLRLFPHQDLDTAPGGKKRPQRRQISFLCPAARAARLTPSQHRSCQGAGERPGLHVEFPSPVPSAPLPCPRPRGCLPRICCHPSYGPRAERDAACTRITMAKIAQKEACDALQII